jgi:hypothetical protein
LWVVTTGVGGAAISEVRRVGLGSELPKMICGRFSAGSLECRTAKYRTGNDEQSLSQSRPRAHVAHFTQAGISKGVSNCNSSCTVRVCS